MSGDIVKALRRRDELTKELEEINRLIELYERHVGPIDELHERTENDGDSVPVRRRRRIYRRTGVPAQIANHAEVVLREEERPIQRGELAELIEGRGVQIPSDDKPRYLGTVLWRRQDLFANIEGRGYILRNEPPAEFEGMDFPEVEEVEEDDSPTGD